jgi:hypothetical protein
VRQDLLVPKANKDLPESPGPQARRVPRGSKELRVPLGPREKLSLELPVRPDLRVNKDPRELPVRPVRKELPANRA